MWQLLYTYGIPQSYLLQGTAPNIKASFGLVWDSRTPTTRTVGQQWVYDSPNSSNSGGRFDPVSNPTRNAASVVKTLSTVQSEAREPDFFEILKAVILSGSVGLGSGSATTNTFVTSDPNYYSTTNNLSANYQIMQIGANIIDAWDTDNVPTFLNYGANNGTTGFAQQIVGIENLPYLSKLVYCATFGNHSPPPNNDYSSWLIPSFWNPHQNAGSAIGDVRFALTTGSVSGVVKSATSTYTTPAISGSITGSLSTPWIQVHANGFSTPSPPIPGAAGNETANSGSVFGPPDGTTPTYDAFFFGTFSNPPNSINYNNVVQTYPIFSTSPTKPNFEMQVSINGIWRPYQRWFGCAQSTTPVALQGLSPQSKWKNTTYLDPEFVSIDPRTVRFGVWGNDGKDSGNTNDYTTGAVLTLDENNGGTSPELIFSLLPQGTNFKTTDANKSAYLYAVNQSSNVDYYSDLDGVVRNGDWPTGNGSTNGTTIMYPGNSADRPQILSSPFQSVAELGQVFRDQPWKTLAFTIANSGDAGLLDAFTLQDVSVTGTAPSSPSPYVWMTAGRTSLNTRQAPVLTAIMSQVSKAIAGTGIIPTSSTDTTVSNIANALVKLTTTTPMISKGDLVARLAGDPSVTGLGNKEARESVMRALSDAGQTRTWNLMIDVIAQSGRYPASAANLSQFVVEGEQRYWVHVAIDRFTGQVIDRQVEVVKE